MLIVITILILLIVAQAGALILVSREYQAARRERLRWQDKAFEFSGSFDLLASDRYRERDENEDLRRRLNDTHMKWVIAEIERDNAHRCLELVLKEEARWKSETELLAR